MRNRIFEWLHGNPAAAQTAIAILALVGGVLVYVIDRDPSRVYFLPDTFSFSGYGSLVFGRIGHHLPDFLHVYAFILLTCAALKPGKAGIFYISAFWLAIDTLFEIGQYPALAPSIAEHVPSWFMHIPFLENTGSYFTAGHFDVIDLVAYVLGTISAYITVTWMPAYDSSSS